MSYNIRLDIASDGENSWANRSDFLISQVQFLAPHIMGVQEARPGQMKDLAAGLPRYDYIGTGRDGGDAGEYSAIFYDADYLSVTQENTIWLSPTPDQFSQGWDAAYPRICTYGLFASKTGKDKFWVFNTHLDHVGKEAQINGTRQILETISVLNNLDLPVIFMGDLNVEPGSTVYSDITASMRDSRAEARVVFGPEGTFNGFSYEQSVERRIDYIFLSDEADVQVEKYAVLSSAIDQRYPSDHFPVYVEISTRK